MLALDSNARRPLAQGMARHVGTGASAPGRACRVLGGMRYAAVSVGMNGAQRAVGLVKSVLSLADGGLRASYVASVVRAWHPAVLAEALDAVCQRAEQAEHASREALVAIVDALNSVGMDGIVQRLREEAAGGSLL